ncbi:hypothetical protein ACQPZ8_01255 [Actinomadura nitritigenes]|uniref:hypothetical protein n=1 Tax=Actinomadura nitritigenes TaxID=134602 RepID=UPI003D937400
MDSSAVLKGVTVARRFDELESEPEALLAMARPVLLWGAATSGRRQHAFATYLDTPPAEPLKPLCNTTRSPSTKIEPARDVPRCPRCAWIARAWLAGGWASANDDLEGIG